MAIGRGQQIEILGLTRGASGQFSGRSKTINVTFKVGTKDKTVGPLAVMEAFPVGSPIHNYMSVSELNSVVNDVGVKTMTAPWYRWPEGNLYCTDPSYDPPNNSITEQKTRFTVSNVSIQGRDGGGTALTVWLVNVTFTDTTMDQGAGSSPVVRPRFDTVQRTVEVAEFEGWFRRSNGTVDNEFSHHSCQMRPGEWQQFCINPNDGALPSPPGQGGTSTSGKPIRPINSAGDVIKKPMKYGHARESYEVEWFSYTILNMHCAIGKTNANEYVLRAWDRPPVDMVNSSMASALAYQPVLIFCKKFAVGELLVSDINCTPMNWAGRNCYKYTVTLIADPDFHKAYVLDSGNNSIAKEGEETSTGETVTSDDVQGTTQATQPAVDVLGKNKEILLDGSGRPLAQGNSLVDPSQAVYLRYKFRQQIAFPTDVLSQDQQYHNYDPNSDFQFLMDGGFRYKYPDQYQPWEDCDDDNVRLEVEPCGQDGGAKQDNESAY